MYKLDQNSSERYHRQMILPQIGEDGQRKLQNARVLVIGAGGLGSPVLIYLASSGIGTLGVIDFDKVDISNLQRQVLFDTEDIGKYKTKVAKDKVAKLNPEITVNTYNYKLTKDNIFDLIDSYDVIVDGSDNFPTRYLVNDATVISDKPLVFGAVYQFEGQASVFNYNNGPTYRCLFPEQPDSSAILSCATGGVMGPLTGIIGSIQANEAIKIILGIGDTLSGRLLQMDSLTFDINVLHIPVNKENMNIETLGDYGTFCNSSIKEITAGELEVEIAHNSNIKIYDLRSSDKFYSFNIGGERITSEDLLENPETIPKNMKVIILCEHGEQSSTVVEYLQEEEHLDNIYNLEGGINRWIKTIINH